jgi:hypothetical protein
VLIYIRHAETGELAPDRLIFNFEETSVRQWLGLNTNRSKKGRDEEPVFIPIPRGGQVFAQLSPGRGDAFCISLPASSRFEVNIIISPPGSLDRNPRTPLHINTPDAEDPVVHLNYTDMMLGKIRLLYIAPENLISRSFRDDLFALIRRKKVNSLIIDKAHCISEWGGDFKPSYLRIPQVIEDLRKKNPQMTALAVTAVSGRMIGKDIKSLLNLKDQTPPARKNLWPGKVSYQVIETGGPVEKARAYEKLFLEDLPAILTHEGFLNPSADPFPPYQDPYEPALGLNSGKSSNRHVTASDVSVITRKKGDTPEKPHMRVHLSLSGSIENWFYKTLRAGKGKNRVHCVRLADLPVSACEEDMEERKSSVPGCGRFKCPFGREFLCDYGKQHHLIQKNYPGVPEGVLQALKTLDQLLLSFKAGDNPLRVPLNFMDQRTAELALYRLSLLNILELFFIDYREGEPVFKVYGFTHDMNNEAAQAGVLNYLIRHDISLTRRYAACSFEQITGPNGEIAYLWERYGPVVQNQLEQAVRDGDMKTYPRNQMLFHKTAEYLPAILCHVNDEIRVMLYRILWNFKEFIKDPACISSRLIKTVSAGDENWKCGWCSRCEADLNFAPDPPAYPELMILDDRLERWLDNDEVPFDTVTADQLIRDFGNYKETLFLRARRALEYSPRNIKALYLARELAPDSARGRCAFDLVTVASRDLPPHQAIHMYETSKVDGKTKALLFDILDDAYGSMNSAEGQQWLHQEAVSLSIDTPRLSMLRANQILNALKIIDLPALNEKLHHKLKEFDYEPVIQP